MVFNGIPSCAKQLETGANVLHSHPGLVCRELSDNVIPDEETLEKLIVADRGHAGAGADIIVVRAGNNSQASVEQVTLNVPHASKHGTFQHIVRTSIHLVPYCVSFCLLFSVAWAVFGTSKLLPGADIFDILILYTAAVSGGWFMKSVKMPTLLGQLLAAIVVRNIWFTDAPSINSIEWSKSIRLLAVTCIWLRAGVGLDAKALREVKFNVLLLAVVPVLVESSFYATLTHFLVHFPWKWAFLLGFLLSAVSPADVVPTALRLQKRNLGVAKGIPTLMITASCFDNAVSLAGVTFMLTTIVSAENYDHQLWKFLQGPIEVAGGILYGCFVGFVLWIVPDISHTHALAFRIALLCGFGTLAVFGALQLDFTGGGGAIGCFTAAFVAAVGWRRRSINARASCAQVVHNAKFQPEHQKTDALSVTFVSYLARAWSVVLQPLLFALIGAEISFSRLDASSMGIGLVILVGGMVIRLVASVIAVSIGCGNSTRLEWKERAFIALAWMPKATVQAAVGPLIYDTVKRLAKSEHELELASKVLSFALLVILITVPIGSIATSVAGKRLLKKSDDNKNSSVENEEVSLSDGSG